jgi:fatty acid synthase subunit alpha
VIPTNHDVTQQAWHIVGLMDTNTASFCDLEPMMADLSGGLSSSINLRPVLKQIQDKISLKSEMNRSLYKERLHESGDNSSGSSPAPPRRLLAPKARIQVEKAGLPDYHEIQPLAAKLQDMVDLERVVVVVGFGEVSKYNRPLILRQLQFRRHFS